MLKPHFLAIAGLSCFLFASANAQNQKSSQTSPQPKSAVKAENSRPVVSLTTLLQLREAQIARLNRIYDDSAARRFKQENNLAQSQQELRIAQSPTAFDERKSARLTRQISEAQQKVAADFFSARAKSLQTLEAVQRAQLESLASDNRFQVRPDMFYELFLMPVEQLGQMPRAENRRFQTAQNRNSRDSRRNGYGGTATYGAYGGYGWGGPQYGVRAGYGRGPIGANIGIGRGGPSVSIGIGGIFGGGL